MTNEKPHPDRPAQPELDDYTVLMAELGLISIRLGTASIRFSPEIYAAKRLPPVSFSLTAELGEVSAKGFEAIQEFVIKGRETTRSPILMSIKCRFVARYKTQMEITPELFAVFKDTTLILNVWPYIREFVQSCVVRAGLPPLTLPSQIFLPRRSAES